MCAFKSVFSCLCVNSFSGVIYSPQSEALSGAGHMDHSFSPPPPHLLTPAHQVVFLTPPLPLLALFQSLSSSYFSILKEAFFNCCPPHPLPPRLHFHFSRIWTSYHQTLLLYFYLIFLPSLLLSCFPDRPYLQEKSVVRVLKHSTISVIVTRPTAWSTLKYIPA